MRRMFLIARRYAGNYLRASIIKISSPHGRRESGEGLVAIGTGLQKNELLGLQIST